MSGRSDSSMLAHLSRAIECRLFEARKGVCLWGSKRLCPPTRKALEVMTPFELAYALNISTRHRYVYVENPKTGCSSLKLACLHLEGIDDGLRREVEDHDTLHDPARSPLKRLVRHPSLRPLSSLMGAGYTFVTFVRNPYQRLISCYQDKIARSDAPNKYTRMLFGERPGPYHFPEFIEAVVAMDDLAMDPHWKPQTAQTLFGIVPYAFIGRFENFSEDYYRLFAALGIQADQVPKLRHLNKSQGNGAEGEGYYDRRLQELVYRRYQNDFTNFHYPYELPV